MSKKKNDQLGADTENTAAADVNNKPKQEKHVDPAEAAAKAEKKRFNKRKFRYGGAATAVTVIVIVVVVLVNVVLSVLSERMNMSIDITSDKAFEISQESIDYLATVNEPVEIVCMSDELEFSTSNYVFFKQAYEVLKKYTIYSDNVTLTFVDMTENPTYANKYQELYKGDISEYSIVVSTDKRIKVLSIQDLYNVEMNNYYEQTITSSKAEQELTSAIMYVTDPDPMNAVFFNSETGGSSYDNVYNMLSSNGYNVSEINPLVDPIPEDADLIVINAPLNDYDEELVQKLYDFLDNNGQLGRNLIYIADYSQNSTANIDAFLAEWGISVGNGVVGDSNMNNTSSASSYVIGNYINTADNEYAANVSDPSLPVLSYYARPISLAFDTKDNRRATALITTDDTAFVLTDELQAALQNGENVEPEYASYTTMAIGSKYVFNDANETVFSNVLVVGSSAMLDKGITEKTYYNNGDYFVSTLNEMTGKTAGISIVAKDLTTKTFEMTQSIYNTCFITFVIVVPLAVLVCGMVVYLRRRHK